MLEIDLRNITRERKDLKPFNGFLPAHVVGKTKIETKMRALFEEIRFLEI